MFNVTIINRMLCINGDNLQTVDSIFCQFTLRVVQTKIDIPGIHFISSIHLAEKRALLTISISIKF
jgi:hypothetical protein